MGGRNGSLTLAGRCTAAALKDLLCLCIISAILERQRIARESLTDRPLIFDITFLASACHQSQHRRPPRSESTFVRTPDGACQCRHGSLVQQSSVDSHSHSFDSDIHFMCFCRGDIHRRRAHMCTVLHLRQRPDWFRVWDDCLVLYHILHHDCGVSANLCRCCPRSGLGAARQWPSRRCQREADSAAPETTTQTAARR